MQFIDVRDLAEWMVHCLEQNVTGVHLANGFAGPVTMEQVLIGCQCASARPGTLVWASEEFLQENKVGAWMEMPLWIPRAGRTLVKNDKAVAAGLRFRPLGDTIRDTLQWARSDRGDKPFARTGVKADKEKELLAKWREQGKAAK